MNKLNILCFKDGGSFLLEVGKKQDIFKQYGLEVSIEFTINAEQTHEAVLRKSSNYDIVLMSYDDYLFCLDKVKSSQEDWQVPLILLGVHDGFLSLVTTDPNIVSISDLKGKKIAIDTRTGYASFLFKFLKENGLETKDIEIILAGATNLRYEKLLKKQFDATLLGAPFSSMALENGCKILSNLSENIKYAGQIATINPVVFSDKFTDVMAFKKAFSDILMYFWNQENKERIQVYLEDSFGSLSLKTKDYIYNMLTQKKSGYCWNGFFDNEALLLTQMLHSQYHD